jgi:phytoene dehydrogenase-like protein
VIDAKVAVIAQIHPWLIGDEVESVDAGVVQRAKRVRTAKISLMEQHLALNEPPKYKAGYEAANVVLAGFAPPTMERFLRVFDHYKYGDMWSGDSNDTIMAARMHGQFDPTQCPPGKCALTFYAFGPFDMRGGAEKWDECQWKVADRLLDHYRTFTTNMTDENIIGRRFDTPLELSRHSSMFQKGDVNGAGEFLFQMGGHRPNPELAKLKIPGIENLYLGGAAINVSSVSGGGRATAIKACQDLQIDFDRLIG